MLLLRSAVLESLNLESVTVCKLINHITTNAANLHFVEHLNKVIISSFIRCLNDYTWSVLSIFDFVKLFLILCVFVPMLLCFLAPIIVVLLVIRYFMRRHKDRVRLTEMAMEKGEPFSDELKPLSKKSPEYMWRRGVRNTSIGAGLMIFFWFFGMQSLMGIGALVACIGLGQMFMVKYNYDSKMPWQKRDDEDETDH